MRQSNLAAVLLGVGMFTGQTSAQPALTPGQAHAEQAMQDTLSRRAREVLDTTMKARMADVERLHRNGDGPRFEFKGDVPNLLPPMDCGMPVMTGNPAIDPQFSKQLPTPTPGKSFWSMKVIPVKPCPR